MQQTSRILYETGEVYVLKVDIENFDEEAQVYNVNMCLRVHLHDMVTEAQVCFMVKLMPGY